MKSNLESDRVVLMNKEGIFDLHLGEPQAFGTWKLIWTDDTGNTYTETVSKSIAKKLILCGMSSEG